MESGEGGGSTEPPHPPVPPAGQGSFLGEAAGPGPGVAPGPGGERVAMGKTCRELASGGKKKKQQRNPTPTKPHRHSSIKSISANRRGKKYTQARVGTLSLQQPNALGKVNSQ